MQGSHKGSPSSGNPQEIQNSLAEPSFSPFLLNTLKVQADSGFGFGSACYNQKQNMMIAYPQGRTIQFYDATTLLPREGREPLQLDYPVVHMSYFKETDTYIVGCIDGSIYSYNVSSHELKNLKTCEMVPLITVYLSPKVYAFSSMEFKKLYIGTLEDEDVLSFDLNNECYCLHHVPKSSLLFVGLDDGFVMVYRANKLPHLELVCSIQAHSKGLVGVQSVNINGEEYIITTGLDRTVKTWHLGKGTTRLIRVIRTEYIPYSVVYLEKYKLLAISSQTKYVTFLKFPSMKLERTVSLTSLGIHYMFLMKDKNIIGVVNELDNVVEFIQLGGKEN